MALDTNGGLRDGFFMTLKNRTALALKILAALAVLQALWFGFALHRATPAPWGDTYQYQEVADELARGHLGIIRHHQRPPGYPAILLAAQAIGVKPSVLSVLFNRLSALLAIALVPELAMVGVAAGYLLLCGYSTIVSYENFLMSESPLPGFLMLAWMLALLAHRSWKRRRFEAATALLAAQFLLLTSLKPAFKAYCILELGILGLLCWRREPRIARAERPRVALNAVALLAVMVLTNTVVFTDSGEHPMRWNKSVSLTQTLPAATAEEQAAWPERARATYKTYQKLWAHMPADYDGSPPVSAIEGAELFDLLSRNHRSAFLKIAVLKMINLVRFSSWNENFGKIDMRIGIPRGFGSLGILFTTCLFGAALAFAMGKGAKPGLTALLETGLGAAYAFAVQLFVAVNDVARISLMWLIPAFVFLVQAWWLVWGSEAVRAAARAGTRAGSASSPRSERSSRRRPAR
jgi:hypothetical protein